MRRIALLAGFLLVTTLLALLFTWPTEARQVMPLGITDTPTPTSTPTPTPTTVPPAAPPVVPEASTWLLLGSSATGLAAYVTLQVRARRHRR